MYGDTCAQAPCIHAFMVCEICLQHTMARDQLNKFARSHEIRHRSMFSYMCCIKSTLDHTVKPVYVRHHISARMTRYFAILNVNGQWEAEDEARVGGAALSASAALTADARSLGQRACIYLEKHTCADVDDVGVAASLEGVQRVLIHARARTVWPTIVWSGLCVKLPRLCSPFSPPSSSSPSTIFP